MSLRYILDDPFELFVCNRSVRVVPFSGDEPSHPLDHLGEPRGLDRFQQVVDGADLERLDRVLIERGDEHDMAPHPTFQQLARHLEPGEPRHLDIEEHHVRRQRFRQRDSLEPVGRLVDNLDVVELLELKRQLAAGRLLVVGNQDPQGHC